MIFSKWILNFLSLLAVIVVPVSHADQKQQVNLLLVLATDVSSSISNGSVYQESGGRPGGPMPARSEWQIQKAGIVEALKDPDVAQMLEMCNGRGVALTYVEWSGKQFVAEAKQVVDWMHLRSGADLARFAKQIEASPRSFIDGSTDIATALSYSAELFENAPFTSTRRIIDISGDGKQNINRPALMYGGTYDENGGSEANLSLARDRIVESGILINAIVLMDETDHLNISKEPLDFYFERNVRGGPGSFVVPVDNLYDFKEEFKHKLLVELNNCYS